MALTACATALVSAGVAVLAMKSAATTRTDAAEADERDLLDALEGLNCTARRWRTAAASRWSRLQRGEDGVHDERVLTRVAGRRRRRRRRRGGG